jgi:hypothetical protein
MDDQRFYETLARAMHRAARDCGMLLSIERDLTNRRIAVRWQETAEGAADAMADAGRILAKEADPDN